jgi:hypothetical protein
MATLKRISGPAFLASSVANIYTPPTGTGCTPYVVIRHIHIANKTAASATFSLYIGATGGSASGTEIFKDQTVAANSAFDYFPITFMASTDFLTGLASAANTLVITVEGEMGIQ